jgi:hypothetical protein
MAGRRRVRSAKEAAQQVEDAGLGSGEGARTAPVGHVSTRVDYGGQVTAKDEAQSRQSPALREAIQAARLGDDSLLMPYQPSPSTNPSRPRTVAYGYDRASETMFVRFRDGAAYEYYNVPPRVFNNFRRVKSPGRAINRTLNFFPYARADY